MEAFPLHVSETDEQILALDPFPCSHLLCSGREATSPCLCISKFPPLCCTGTMMNSLKEGLCLAVCISSTESHGALISAAAPRYHHNPDSSNNWLLSSSLGLDKRPQV